jgi:SAM-dependent methyltransferase
VDAVLSTTALHWLPADSLVRVYRQLGQLVRPGGVFLNGDELPFAPHLASFRRAADAVRDRQQAQAFERDAVENWDQWWAALAAEPGLAPLLAERERRFGWRKHVGHHPIVDVHEAGLRDAGFREVGVIWQHLDDRVVMAVR